MKNYISKATDLLLDMPYLLRTFQKMYWLVVLKEVSKQNVISCDENTLWNYRKDLASVLFIACKNNYELVVLKVASKYNW